MFNSEFLIPILIPVLNRQKLEIVTSLHHDAVVGPEAKAINIIAEGLQVLYVMCNELYLSSLAEWLPYQHMMRNYTETLSASQPVMQPISCTCSKFHSDLAVGF